MDIIIRNGVIQQSEQTRVHEIKNNEGLLKKDYNNFINVIPGPYYDLLDCHLCIPRTYDQIPNFCGPQIKNKIKLIETSDFNKKFKYCSICHSMMKPNPAFSSKRKMVIDEDEFARKEDIDISDILNNKFKKFKISNKNTESMDLLLVNIEKLNIDFSHTWNNLFTKLYKNSKQKILENEYRIYKNLQTKTIFKYYQIIYKLTKTPILYPISNTQTELIWPWDLTRYQKFRLNSPNYKLMHCFNHNNNYKITENYVVIE